MSTDSTTTAVVQCAMVRATASAGIDDGRARLADAERLTDAATSIGSMLLCTTSAAPALAASPDAAGAVAGRTLPPASRLSPETLVRTLASDSALAEWIRRCPNPTLMRDAIATIGELRRPAKCDYCGEQHTFADLRDTPRPQDTPHAHNGMCRDCWTTTTDGAWPPRRDDVPEPEVPLAHSYLYTQDGWMVGEVCDYYPSAHYGHVTLYGMEQCAESGPLDAAHTVRAEPDAPRRRELRFLCDSTLHTMQLAPGIEGTQVFAAVPYV